MMSALERGMLTSCATAPLGSPSPFMAALPRFRMGLASATIGGVGAGAGGAPGAAGVPGAAAGVAGITPGATAVESLSTCSSDSVLTLVVGASPGAVVVMAA